MTVLLYDLVGADPERPFSPHCWKAAMALAHKGLAFERVPTPFTSVRDIEGATAGTVPVIRDAARTVEDSFAIALYLEEAYPDRPSLFGGPGGVGMARFVERWSQLTIHVQLTKAIILDIHDILAPKDQAYFRPAREARLGAALEAVVEGREARRDAFRASLEPLRSTLSYQPFIGGERPLFCDYIVFGAFQWARVASPYPVLDAADPIRAWFERCLDLHGGLGRSVASAV